MDTDCPNELAAAEICPRAREWAREVFSNDAAYLLTNAAQAARGIFGDALEAIGLTPRQMAVLDVLKRREPLRQQELGGLLGIDRSSMVTIIDELEAKGLAVRESDPADRRAHAVSLTPAGTEKAAEARSVLDLAQGTLLACLTGDEWTTLRDLLLKVLDNQT